MGEIVNLRQVRRRQARAAAAQAAEENRVRHGRTGAQKQADRSAAARTEATHRANKLDRDKAPAEP